MALPAADEWAVGNGPDARVVIFGVQPRPWPSWIDAPDDADTDAASDVELSTAFTDV